MMRVKALVLFVESSLDVMEVLSIVYYPGEPFSARGKGCPRSRRSSNFSLILTELDALEEKIDLNKFSDIRIAFGGTLK